MKTTKKRAAIVATIITLVAIATVNMPHAYSAEAELTANEKATEFLTSVVGLNLAKYNLTKPPSDGYSYPPKLCGLVKEEKYNYKYEANGSKISAMSTFYNGQMVFFDISTQGTPVYSEAPPSDILNQAKTILQRYQTYVTQVYDTDDSYLMPMQNTLNSISDLSPTNITNGNVILQISTNGAFTRFQWIYTEKGVPMRYKTVDLTFLKNSIDTFVDTWNLYSIGAFSVIDSEEAYKLALDTAQNMEFRIVNDEVNQVVPLPDLSKSGYQMYFTMLPYHNETSHMPSKISRSPLKLYPYWQFYFYFTGEEIGGYSGVQVGIWGDTKEIIYCSGFGFLGSSGTASDDEDTSLEWRQQEQPNPSEQPTTSPQQTSPSTHPAIAAAITAIAIPAVLIPAILLRRRKQQKG
jgi:hypothetical protein